MNAIRRDEDTDNIHSIYVDQWDWEKIIRKEDRTVETLQEAVRTVYKCLEEKTKNPGRYSMITLKRSCRRKSSLSPPRNWKTDIRISPEKKRISDLQRKRSCFHHADRRSPHFRHSPRRPCSRLRRLGFKRRYSGLLSNSGHCAGTVLHGNPCR